MAQAKMKTTVVSGFHSPLERPVPEYDPGGAPETVLSTSALVPPNHHNVAARDGILFQTAQLPPSMKPDGGIDGAAVTAITITELADYHD